MIRMIIKIVSTANGVDRHVVDHRCRWSWRGRRIWSLLSVVVVVVPAQSPTAEQKEKADQGGSNHRSG